MVGLLFKVSVKNFYLDLFLLLVLQIYQIRMHSKTIMRQSLGAD